MIITRTPFRVPLGGGGTDLPGFYKKHGGYIFSTTVDKYMYVCLNRPAIDKLIRIKYSESETVDSLDKVRHPAAREALRACGILDTIEVTSFADISAGTGMGSSSSYLVGLLKALHTMRQEEIRTQDLAEEACRIDMEVLRNPVGKQDQYLAAFGGFVEMEIAPDGTVTVSRPHIPSDTIEELEFKVGLYFTNKFHKSEDILGDQNAQAAVSESTVEKCLLTIKEIGRQLKHEMVQGKLENFGKFLDEHWKTKKQMSSKISDPELDRIYDIAMHSGAEGGKIMGSGGGGLFMFFCPEGKKKLKSVLEAEGLREMKYNFDFEGSKVLLNIFQYTNGFKQ